MIELVSMMHLVSWNDGMAQAGDEVEEAASET
jgi:hypothetical protein